MSEQNISTNTPMKQGSVTFHSLTSLKKDNTDYDMIIAITLGDVKHGNGYRITHNIKELAPSSELFNKYQNDWKGKCWNQSTFNEQYMPWLIKDMTRPASVNALAFIYDTVMSGKNICMVCFCVNESLCHRSIIAGILKGSGLDNIILEHNEPDPTYYDMWKKAMISIGNK